MISAAIDASVLVASIIKADRFHDESDRFLQHTVARGIGLVAPGIMLIESACAVARRTGSEELARATTTDLLGNEFFSLTLDGDDGAESVLETIALGTRLRLKGADAIYAATAERHDVPLVTWDRELIARAGAITPTDWLARHE
jgi:predicted nucleic acid-binding protein